MNELVSIIVPTYNDEAYISACIKSLSSQSYTNIEIIIIDDGSTDGTVDKIRELSTVDQRIHFQVNQHAGVSHTRNTGIEFAKGEYLTFVDGDDTVSPYYVEQMLISMKKNNSDITICRIGDIYYPYSTKVVERNLVRPLTGNFTDDYYALLPFLYGSCLKLFRRKIIRENNILFPEDMSFSEDEYFNLTYYQYVSNYSFCDNCLYFYHHRFSSSLSTNHSTYNFVKYQKKLLFEKQMLEKLKIKDKDKILLEHSLFIIKSFLYLGKNDTYQNSCDRIKSIDNITHFLDMRSEMTLLQRRIVLFFNTRLLYVLGIVKYHIRNAIFSNSFMKRLYAFIKSR